MRWTLIALFLVEFSFGDDYDEKIRTKTVEFCEDAELKKVFKCEVEGAEYKILRGNDGAVST